jgi:hypothetical protein
MTIGIYNDEFLQYLEINLGPIKTNPKNIIVPCPWCDVGTNTSKSHLWISMHDPIFHCFRGGCNQSGLIRKLTEKIEGTDTSGSYVNQERVKHFKVEKVKFEKNIYKPKDITIPILDEDKFKLKSLYIKQRLKFSNVPLSTIPGLIFDIDELIRINNIQLPEKVIRFKDYLQTNFVGFLTENNSCVSLRNIDSKSEFRYYKLDLQPSQLLDYYKLYGNRRDSNHIIMAEGIFDIYTEHIYDVLGLKNKAKAYIAALSTSYLAAIKSVIFNEQIFRPIIHILSDKEIKISYYEKIMKYNKHLIKSLNVYYNKTGKDFNDTPINVSCINILSN